MFIGKLQKMEFADTDNGMERLNKSISNKRQMWPIFQIKKIREGLKKKRKIVCKITHLGGWVAQEWDKLHRKNKKKHAFKIHFRPF